MIKNTQDIRRKTQDAKGFSLTEVLIAVGLLAMGMLFIAGAFPVSIHFTTVATERTIAPIVADEAFAKLKLYGPDFNNAVISDAEYAYPSTPTADPNSRQYWWSFVYKYADTNEVVVFVFRKVGLSSQYWVRTSGLSLTTSAHPALIYVAVSASPSGRQDELMINDLVADGIDETSFINVGYTIVDAGSGRIYRVLERYSASPNIIRLDKDWVGILPVAPTYTSVWVASPSVNSGRYPCIGVYQKNLRF
jgi:prepilin-type N-terminal cleavage/methylation domain-containing protein